MTIVPDGASEFHPPHPAFDEVSGRTIIGVRLDVTDPFSAALTDEPLGDTADDGALDDQKLLKVRLADTEPRWHTARTLVERMYEWRGYQLAWQAQRESNKVTLVASHGMKPMATISIGLDSDAGLLVDALFDKEVDGLRAKGLRVCEFTKLAVDGATRSKRVLATLFHIAYLYAHKMNGYTDLLVEVNPRHVRFYEAMLGFKQFGPERINPRVAAPAVLLRLQFSHLAEQLARFAGRADLARTEKSLYPFGFPADEEANVMNRLKALG